MTASTTGHQGVACVFFLDFFFQNIGHGKNRGTPFDVEPIILESTEIEQATRMKEFWEQRYTEKGWVYGTEPNEFLLAQKALFPAGAKVLVVGDGEGRNGVWLAQQGLDVTSVDYAASGLRKARELALAKGARLNTMCVDLTQWTWPRAAYDAVVSIYVHFPPAVRAAMHRAMLEALKPNGVLLLEAFNKDQVRYSSGGPRDAAMLYAQEELQNDFAGAQIEHLETAVVNLNEGQYHRGPGAVLRLILRQPASVVSHS